jgi:hypothetical protein
MRRDGIGWEITVWHLYDYRPEWGLQALQKYGKPIWVTEFRDPVPAGSIDETARKANLERILETLRSLSVRYRIEAAFVYELLDEPYWGDTGEARQGLLRLCRAASGWHVADPTPSFFAVQAMAAGRVAQSRAAQPRASTVDGRCPP